MERIGWQGVSCLSRQPSLDSRGRLSLRSFRAVQGQRLQICGQERSDTLRGWREDPWDGQNAVQRVCEDYRKFGSQKIDNQLQIPVTVDAGDDERTAALVGACHQIQRQFPQR